MKKKLQDARNSGNKQVMAAIMKRQEEAEKKKAKAVKVEFQLFDLKLRLVQDEMTKLRNQVNGLVALNDG